MTRVLAQCGDSSSLRLFSFKVFDVIVYTLRANLSLNPCLEALIMVGNYLDTSTLCRGICLNN